MENNKMITATKTQICEKYVEESNKMIKFLEAVKQFCNAVVMEEEQEECGYYRGDGANDPENICRRTFNHPRSLDSVEILQEVLTPAEDEVRDNDFLKLTMMVPTLLELIDNHERIKFPASMFPQKTQKNPEIQFVVLEPMDLEQVLRLIHNML